MKIELEIPEQTVKSFADEIEKYYTSKGLRVIDSMTIAYELTQSIFEKSIDNFHDMWKDNIDIWLEENENRYITRRLITRYQIGSHVGIKEDDNYTKSIVLTWSGDDVRVQGMENGHDLTDEDISGILDGLEENYDSSVGINWEVISAQIEVYLQLKEKGFV